MDATLMREMRAQLNQEGYKDINKQIKSFKGVKELAERIKKGEDGSGQSIAALGGRMARAMGEVGVLTDQDVTRYVGDVKWSNQFRSWLDKGMKGKLPEEVIDGIVANVDSIESRLSKDVDGVMNTVANRMTAGFPGVEKERVFKMLDYEPEPEKVRMRAPNGKEIFVPADKVQEALKRKATLVE